MYNDMSGRCVHCKAQHDVHIIRNSTIYASGRRVVYWQRYENGWLVGHYNTWTQALIGVYPVFIDELMEYPPQQKYSNHISWNDQYPGYMFQGE